MPHFKSRSGGMVKLKYDAAIVIMKVNQMREKRKECLCQN